MYICIHNLVIVNRRYYVEFSYYIKLFYRDQSLRQRRFDYIYISSSQFYLARRFTYHFSHSIYSH